MLLESWFWLSFILCYYEWEISTINLNFFSKCLYFAQQEGLAALGDAHPDSEKFKALPMEIQHEILSELKERRKYHSLSRMCKMPEVYFIIPLKFLKFKLNVKSAIWMNWYFRLVLINFSKSEIWYCKNYWSVWKFLHIAYSRKI